MNLAVAEIVFLAVAAVGLNFKPNETDFARIRCFTIFPVRTYSWPFWVTREDLDVWSSKKELHQTKSSAVLWSFSYYRTATIVTANLLQLNDPTMISLRTMVFRLIFVLDIHYSFTVRGGYRLFII